MLKVTGGGLAVVRIPKALVVIIELLSIQKICYQHNMQRKNIVRPDEKK